MSGHSKWSTIKRQKGSNDAKRGQTFTKIANAISIAVKLGGSGDPDSNPRLRMVLSEARSLNLPKENIARAIDRGLGNQSGQALEEILFEVFGPHKSAFLIETVTDNRTRTIQEIRNLIERAGGSLASPGAVSYMFERLALIKIKPKSTDLDSQTLELIDLGVLDVDSFEEEGESKFMVSVDPHNLSELSNKVTQSGFVIESSNLVYHPTSALQITEEETAEKLKALQNKVEDLDDVQNVYANFELPTQ